MAAEEEHEGASVKELLIEACRRNNTELLVEVLADRSEDDISTLLNSTTTVMGNHLYHEAASHGNYEIIDLLLDQPNFECDPVNRLEGDTPLHTVIRWLNAEPPAQRPFGRALIDMMLEAGSNPRVRNKARLTPLQLVDPSNKDLRDLIQQHEYASQNAGDFVNVDARPSNNAKSAPPAPPVPGVDAPAADDSDDDAEFSGSDDEERAEWERRRKERGQRS
ncbi:ankyrin repeats (many copies) domain-containing protein [Hirsutella rhossiliensis]|uniref:Ankyrin repeats (Many copies) domain-containing protein n=1 Tax=Hirsutella rhossiliensis TaxID=111463 RepID=A0A9P8SJS4_9HYPO|nr:ankyrin repeats (many copies) domain-containing protein [Hirsutella rhossiliensis]KAH0964025.1 ankyrin repeats (many copies) domain-containing protein [Hirsutella rhossiliensis]